MARGYPISKKESFESEMPFLALFSKGKAIPHPSNLEAPLTRIFFFPIYTSFSNFGESTSSSGEILVRLGFRLEVVGGLGVLTAGLRRRAAAPSGGWWRKAVEQGRGDDGGRSRRRRARVAPE